jgi:hypothetical protein
MPTTDNIVGTLSASRCRHDYHNISIAASFCLCCRRRSSPPISTTSARWQSILAFAANSPRRSSNSARSTATTRSISARSASVSNTLARRHKVAAIRLILDACCLRCERQRHRHRRHRHRRISVDAFSFVCLFVFHPTFFNSMFFFFFFFVFCFLVDTDATAGVGPRGLLNNISDSGVSELDGSYLRSLDAARHGAYCTARAAVGNENEANAAQQEQCRQRARCRRRQQRQICNIANSIFESAAVYSQFAPVVLLGEIFIYIYITIRLTVLSVSILVLFCFCSLLFIYTGMGGGLHKSFNVKGSRTPASAWLNACRLARRGFIVILVDEYNSSKVTGDFCLQTHRLNATKLQIRCVRVALKSSFIDRFERCVFVFFAVYRKANCVVLVLFWLASIDLRNKGMPNRRCRS